MFLPDNIDFTQSEKYILSIRLTPNGFYFSINCPTDQKTFYQNSIIFSNNTSYLKNLEKLLFDFAFFSHNFLKINVIYVNEVFTLVPKDYYVKREEADLLFFNFMKIPSRVMSKDVVELDCRVIWGMDEIIHSFLCRTLLNPSFLNNISVLIPFFYKLHNKSTSALFINFNNDDMIDAIAFTNEKLIFAKTFVAKMLLEDSYSIQKIWEVLRLDSQKDKLFFIGRTIDSAGCIETLKKLVINSSTLSITLPNGLEIKQEEIPTEILYQLCEL